MRSLSLIGALILLSACVTARETPNQTCPAPRLVPTELILGDGARDRGFYGGVSLADIDNDGDLDLMATGGYNPTPREERPYYTFRANTLYINDGAGNFTHSPDPEFLVADNPNSGSTWSDVDNDGDLDAFIGVQHRRPDVFLRNLGGGRFAREPLGDATTTRSSDFSASWADIDRDGDLDLVSGGSTLEPSGPISVFRNDNGQFTRVTGVTIENGRSNPGSTLWVDFDNDGDQDLFVANNDIFAADTEIVRTNDIPAAEFVASQYYRNDGDWHFVRTEGQPFSAREYAGIAAAAGDIDNDGDFDLYLGNGNDHPDGRGRIFLNDGRGAFVLDPRFEGHIVINNSFVAALADFDADGDLDLIMTVFGEGLRLFVNDGSGAYSLVDDSALLSRTGPHSGAATGDIDGDGDIDAIIGAWGYEEHPVTILRNESVLCGSPLRIELRSHADAPDPIGARVTLVTRGAHGERRQLREASGQSTFRSQSGSAFLFGVPHGERVVAAQVRWPDGRLETLRRPRDGVVVRDAD